MNLEMELRDLERWMAASIELTPHTRLDWLQAFSEVWLPRIRAALSAPPPPEPVVRWCPRAPSGRLMLGALRETAEELWELEAYADCTVVRVEIREVPE